MNNVAIEVKGLGKNYRIYNRPADRLKQMLFSHFGAEYGKEFWALRDVDFQVRKGETVGIIGRNGSGKSTLLQLICGTLSPSAGSLSTQGRVAALLELGSGFNPEFTGRENVYLNAGVLGLSAKDVAERFDDIAAFADIGEFIEQPTKTYSSGMMVRLAFAVVAHVDADILVIDEALAVGDAFFTQKCMRFLRGFMKSGTILFVSHDTAAVKNLCTRAIWIEKGRKHLEGTPKEVCESYLQAFYEISQGKSDAVESKVDQQNRPQKVDTPKDDHDQPPSDADPDALTSEFQIFAFSAETPSFGKGGALIVDVKLADRKGMPLTWVSSGELISLQITAQVNDTLDSPVIGFFVKDRLGQFLFGENTYLSYRDRSIICSIGETVHAAFTFEMPILPTGDYSISTAIANGTQECHVQHHWLHDAVIFKVHASSICHGLFGVSMKSIELKKANDRNQTTPSGHHILTADFPLGCHPRRPIPHLPPPTQREAKCPRFGIPPVNITISTEYPPRNGHLITRIQDVKTHLCPKRRPEPLLLYFDKPHPPNVGFK